MVLAITAATPQVLIKPISPRGRARLRSRRRRRRMRRMPEMALFVFKRNGGQLKKEGPRPILPAAPTEIGAEVSQTYGMRYRNCAKFWYECRLAEEMREDRHVRCLLRRERKAVAREGARQMRLLEAVFRTHAHQELKLLFIPAFLFAKVEELAGDPDVGNLGLAVQLETIDVQVFAHQAA